MPVTCMKCGRTMDEIKFYTYPNGEKTQLCKSCLTMHIDNFDPSTYLWLLQKMDVPYVQSVWNKIRDKAYEKDPSKLNGGSVFGKYLSQMKIKQWRDYRWADTEKIKLKQQNEMRARGLIEESISQYDEKLKAQLDAGEITPSEYRTLVSNEQLQKEFLEQVGASNVQDAIGANNQFREDRFIPEDQMPDAALQLSDEDKMRLVQKWGRLYTPQEWITMERDYQNMMNSFDIHDADSINTLILLCKTRLKENQAIDTGDIEGYQKLSRVSDALRKSAKFTAAQKKEQETQMFDNVGALVAFCEKNGGRIPRYDLALPLDKVDEAMKNLKSYVKSLIENDSNIAEQIQTYLRQLTLNEEARRDRQAAKSKGLDFVPITDEDLLAHKNFKIQQQQFDAEGEKI